MLFQRIGILGGELGARPDGDGLRPDEVGRIAAEYSASEAAVIRASLDLGLPELQGKLADEQTAGPGNDYTKPGPPRLAQ